jgi:hypothetical protein
LRPDVSRQHQTQQHKTSLTLWSLLKATPTPNSSS